MPIYTKTWVSKDGCVVLTLAPPEEGSQFCLTLRMENEDAESEEDETVEVVLATDPSELDELIVLLQTIRSAPIPDSHDEDPSLQTEDEESDDDDEEGPDSDEDSDDDDTGNETA